MYFQYNIFLSPFFSTIYHTLQTHSLFPMPCRSGSNSENKGRIQGTHTEGRIQGPHITNIRDILIAFQGIAMSKLSTVHTNTERPHTVNALLSAAG